LSNLLKALSDAKQLAADNRSGTIGCTNREYFASAGTLWGGRLVAQIWVDGQIDLKQATPAERIKLTSPRGHSSAARASEARRHPHSGPHGKGRKN
jgi:hypothetical protein